MKLLLSRICKVRRNAVPYMYGVNGAVKKEKQSHNVWRSPVKNIVKLKNAFFYPLR